jgi:methionine synthase II (cobalamin-independent)
MSQEAQPQGSALVPVRLKTELLSRLDVWISKQDHKPSRPEAIRELLEQVLGAGVQAVGTPAVEVEIERLEEKVADLKPQATAEPSPDTGMAMLRRGRAKSDLAKARNKRQKAGQ